MPLSDALLTPVEGENPSGANLYYDKVFDQIKEARTEDEEVGSAGAWGRTLKKADHVQVIKLATEALSKRTKDLRLVGWLIESHLKREGWPILPAGLVLMKDFQDAFWPTMYPEIDEDGDLGLRVSVVESAIIRFAVIVKTLPLTKSGHNAGQYTESRRLGYEEAADTDEKVAARNDAIEQGAVTPEDFDIGFNKTDKASLIGIETALATTLEKIEELSIFQEEKYGDDYPGMNKLTTAVEEVKQVVAALLYEKRKTDPDPVEEEEQAEEETSSYDEPEQETSYDDAPVAAAPKSVPKQKGGSFSGTPTTEAQAHAAILAGAVFLQSEAMGSPVPYLVCSGIRFGETRLAGAYPSSDFGVAPPTETRQALRRLANDSNWDELLKEGLRALIEPCGRTWLDLHRYLHRAAYSNGYGELAQAIVANVRGLLQDLPDLRTWTMDDDTPVGNAETQQWLETEVVPPPPEPEVQESVSYVEPEPEPEPVYEAPSTSAQMDMDGPAKPELYDEALALVRAKRPGEGIQMLVRDAELQPSGRSKFQRRVQVAQLCLAANQGNVAYPILQQLSREAEQRSLETWETGKMLAQPLALLLKCLDKRGSSAEEKEALFERLCRLDPEAAFDIRL